MNQIIPKDYVLASRGDGSAKWESLSTLEPISTFASVQGSEGPLLFADNFNTNLYISTTGPPGLLTSYIDLSSSALMLSNVPPILAISQKPVPDITSTIANAPPSVVNIENYSTVNIIGVKDVLLSTVMGAGISSPSLFISISSFTSAGYSSISGETFSWRPYVYSTLSTAIGRPSFISSMPMSWVPGVQRLSTSESHPDYSTGDVYFSTISFNMQPYMPYISNSTTKMLVEAEPTYLFPRFFLGRQPFPNLLKSISSYIQYTNATSTIIMSESQNTDWIVSQQSNAYTSNAFSKSMNLPLSSGTVVKNWINDGPIGYYTLYHRIPGGMAALETADACTYSIGLRGGMSNQQPAYMNLMPPENGAFMHIYNTLPKP